MRFTLGRFCHQEVGKHMPCAYVLLSWLSPSGVSLISQRQFMPRVKLYGTRLGDRFNALYASCASLSAPYPLPIRSLSAPDPLPIHSLSTPYLPLIRPLSAPAPIGVTKKSTAQELVNSTFHIFYAPNHSSSRFDCNPLTNGNSIGESTVPNLL